MTRWWLSLSHIRHRRPLPTSRNDLLVALSLSYSIPPASTTTNESLRLVGGFLSTLPASMTTNESIRLVGGSLSITFDTTGLYDHQRVNTTRWWLSLSLIRHHWPLRPPTSQYDSLVALSLSHSTLPASTTANESLRLVGGFLPLPVDTTRIILVVVAMY